MNLTVRTFARYESDQPPTGRALKRFIQPARATKKEELEERLWRALEMEFGLSARQIQAFKMDVLKAQMLLLDLNNEDLTVQKAREIGHTVRVKLTELDAKLAEVNPYSPLNPESGDS